MERVLFKGLFYKPSELLNEVTKTLAEAENLRSNKSLRSKLHDDDFMADTKAIIKEHVEAHRLYNDQTVEYGIDNGNTVYIEKIDIHYEDIIERALLVLKERLLNNVTEI